MTEKKGSFKVIMLVMLVTLVIASRWDKWTWMSDFIHLVLDPTAGGLLSWDLTIGMIIIVTIITFITTLVQKYATDQNALKALKKDQKQIQKQMKEFKDHPEKMMKLQKEQMALMPKQFKLSMRVILFTGIPFVLFFRWFTDYFGVIAEATGGPVRFFGFMGWFIFYLVVSMIVSSILRKKMDVA